MKINSFATSSLVVLSLLFTAGAYAQSVVQAHVPFAFKVGQKQMPAGTYIIDRESGSSFVTVRNVKTGTSVQAMGRTETASKSDGKADLPSLREPVPPGRDLGSRRQPGNGLARHQTAEGS